jgi:hypothetical protein
MPAKALAHVDVDVDAPSGQNAGVIVAMVGEQGPMRVQQAGNRGPGSTPGERVGSVCPECSGVLSEHRGAGMTQWRCRVGHKSGEDDREAVGASE